MIARLFLAVLGLGLAIAQQEYILYTNGPGGVECGKIHHCIQNATCEKKDGLEICECSKDMMMDGNGKLLCSPYKDHNVWIQNDPHLKNFHKEFAGLYSPCPYRVLSLVFVPQNDTKIFLDMFAQNQLCKEGHYFLTKLTLSTTVYLASDMMKQIMEFEGDVSKDMDSDMYNYTLIARSLDTTMLDQPEGVDNMVSVDDSRFVDFTMAVDKDAMDNLLTVEIKGLGVKLFFRPPSTDEYINNIELPMVPGAVFNMKSESWKMVDLSESEFDLASFPEGPSLKDKATELGVSKPIYVQYLMISNSTIEVGYNDTICYETKRIFKEECKSQEDQLQMLATCSSVYAEKEFLECLTQKHPKDEFTVIHKEFFQRCEIALCLKDATECEHMQEEMPKITGCPLPKKIADLDCSTISVEQSEPMYLV